MFLDFHVGLYGKSAIFSTVKGNLDGAVSAELPFDFFLSNIL